jgi:MATE family, multidrug efflux pump
LNERREYKPGGVREMVAISLPMVVSYACDTLMTFTDRLFLSRVGPSEMSAAMGGGLTCFMMMAFFMGLISYTTALVAQYLGTGQKGKCSLALTQALIITVAAYPIILACRPLAIWLFEVMEIPPEQLGSQVIYFNIMIYAVIIGLLRHCMASFFSGIGRTRIVMISALTAMLVNIVLNYILIFGKLGFPAMGIRGAAYGTIIGGFCAVLVLVAAYFGKRLRTEFQVAQSFRFAKGPFLKLLKFGYPAGLEMFLNVLAFDVAVLIFHAHSLATAAASTIMFNWDMVSFVPLIGIEIGVMSLVGRYMGAKKPEIAERSVMSGLKLSWIYSLVILVLFVFFPEWLVNIFRPAGEDPIFTEAAPMAVFMVRVASLYVIVEGGIVVLSGALRGAGDTFWAMVISVSLHWSLVPVLLLMLKVFDCSPETAWVVVVLEFMFFSLLFYLRYRSGKWKEIEVVGMPEKAVHVATEGMHETPDF